MGKIKRKLKIYLLIDLQINEYLKKVINRRINEQMRLRKEGHRLK